MTIITLILMLAVGAAIIYGITLALAGRWKDLLLMVIVLIVALWILSAFGLTLPTIPTLK